MDQFCAPVLHITLLSLNKLLKSHELFKSKDPSTCITSLRNGYIGSRNNLVVTEGQSLVAQRCDMSYREKFDTDSPAASKSAY